MSHIQRRLFCSTALFSVGAALAACAGSGGTAGPPTPAQIIADASGVLTALSASLAAMAIQVPTLIPPATLATLQANLAAGAKALTSISTAMAASASASVIQQVESGINSVLSTLASIPLIPPPYSTVIAAANVLVPVLEAVVGNYLPTMAGAVVAATAKPMALAPTIAAARATLGIAIVS
jgi:hypothetical protein